MLLYLKDSNGIWKLHSYETLSDLANEFAKRNIKIGNDVTIGDYVALGNDVALGNRVKIGNGVVIPKAANIQLQYDLVTINNLGSRNAPLSAVKIKDIVHVATGCFSGTIDEFDKKVKEVHEESEHGMRYLKAIKYIKDQLT
jgi:acetyltransferase-like isoleucine patch superfamily enzyme